MKKYFNILLAFTILGILASCNCEGDQSSEADKGEEPHKNAVRPTASTGNFGEVISTDGAREAAELPALLEGKETVEVKLTGNVDAVCQNMGCWMDVSMGDGQIVHVTFQDDKFLLPKDAAGKQTVFEGVATYEEIPVNMLKHLAKDEGKSQEEIDAITEPKMEYTFVARGVILEDNLY